MSDSTCGCCGRSIPPRAPGTPGRPRLTCSDQCRKTLYDRRRGVVERGSVVPDHGTLARYRGHGCRCDECRAFANAYRYRYPARAQDHAPPPAAKGS